jgi:hypothetical protein
MDVKLITQIKHMHETRESVYKKQEISLSKKKKKHRICFDHAKGLYFRGLVQQLDYPRP